MEEERSFLRSRVPAVQVSFAGKRAEAMTLF